MDKNVGYAVFVNLVIMSIAFNAPLISWNHTSLF